MVTSRRTYKSKKKLSYGQECERNEYVSFFKSGVRETKRTACILHHAFDLKDRNNETIMVELAPHFNGDILKRDRDELFTFVKDAIIDNHDINIATPVVVVSSALDYEISMAVTNQIYTIGPKHLVHDHRMNCNHTKQIYISIYSPWVNPNECKCWSFSLPEINFRYKSIYIPEFGIFISGNKVRVEEHKTNMEEIAYNWIINREPIVTEERPLDVRLYTRRFDSPNKREVNFCLNGIAGRAYVEPSANDEDRIVVAVNGNIIMEKIFEGTRGFQVFGDTIIMRGYTPEQLEMVLVVDQSYERMMKTVRKINEGVITTDEKVTANLDKLIVQEAKITSQEAEIHKVNHKMNVSSMDYEIHKTKGELDKLKDAMNRADAQHKAKVASVSDKTKFITEGMKLGTAVTAVVGTIAVAVKTIAIILSKDEEVKKKVVSSVVSNFGSSGGAMIGEAVIAIVGLGFLFGKLIQWKSSSPT